MAETELASLSATREYFGYKSLSEFGADWKKLPEADRKAIRQGIGDGSFNY